MVLRVTVRHKGIDAYQAVLARVNPSKNPGVVRASFDAIARRLRTVLQENWLKGPRPRRLGQVTGQLAESVAIDRGDLPRAVEVGVPRRLFWYEFHELGLGPWPRVESMAPALDEVLPEMADIHIDAWRAAADVGPGGVRSRPGL